MLCLYFFVLFCLSVFSDHLKVWMGINLVSIQYVPQYKDGWLKYTRYTVSLTTIIIIIYWKRLNPFSRRILNAHLPSLPAWWFNSCECASLRHVLFLFFSCVSHVMHRLAATLLGVPTKRHADQWKEIDHFIFLIVTASPSSLPLFPDLLLMRLWGGRLLKELLSCFKGFLFHAAV